MRKIISVIALSATLLLSSCGDVIGLTKLPNGDLKDEENGIVYMAAPMNIEPEVISAEPYAKCDGIEYYTIGELDGGVWLSEGIGGYVYCSDESIISMRLEDFDAEKLSICREDSTAVVIAEETDADTVKAIVKAYSDGETVERDTGDNRYFLKFTSSKYPGICYALDYYISSDGTGYIFDRELGESKSVGDALEKYIRTE